MARIVVAGAGAVGASVAYHLALAGAGEVVLVDRGEIGGGATSKGMGGVRQQFSTAPEVRLAQASIRFFEELGAPFFEQVGYLFVASTEAGLATLAARRTVQRELAVPVEAVSASEIAEIACGVRTDDLLGGVFCPTDGVGDPVAVTHELVRRARERGVEVRERTPLDDAGGFDVVVIACGARSTDVATRFGIELPVRPLCRQLLETSPLDAVDPRLPMTIELESGFHFRRRGDALVLAMTDAEPRWGFTAEVDETVFEDRRSRLAWRFPPAQDAAVARGWAGLYDMTPDAHAIVGRVGEGVFAACGFSGHGFMQSPAVGRALAEEILEGRSSFDLSPYGLDRFGDSVAFPETAVL